MSYDVNVYGHRELAVEDFVKIAVSLNGVAINEATLEDELPEIFDPTTGELEFTVEGPYRLESEDIPDGWDDVIRSSILYSIIVPTGSEKKMGNALRFADLLAERIEGTVVDLQTYDPPGVSTPDDPTSDGKLYLHAVWCRLPDGASDFADDYLRTARQFFAPVVPTRFGTSEPLQGRLKRDNDGEFVDLYRQECALSDLVFDAKSLDSGTIEGWSNDYHGRLQRIHLRFPLSRLQRPGMFDEFEIFFTELARRTGSFFACAGVNASRYWYSGSPAFRGSWAGLPSQPQWMTWYEPEYLEMVKPSLTSGTIADFPEGSLHKWAEGPLVSSEILTLLRRVPWVPLSLLPKIEVGGDRKIVAQARDMPAGLRIPAPGSPEALRIEANIARNRRE